jgi:hypothetical protein
VPRLTSHMAVTGRRMSNATTFFWLLFSGCALSAGLFVYGIGYLTGVRDATTANVADGDRSFSED